ncbi:MAG TPA: aminopeptidase [Kiritimatiellia bacterium]|nr:aminopeptidase [Kiritimatiellia bacterium]HRZ13765.1 aminopeptidase [Kiritimatiellia bacterium]HSA19704.1 aminopeptidase [Kiritimatiellia bacterium]
MTIDPRIANLARILVRYSVHARPRELIALDATPEATPLVLAAYEELLRAGAYPIVRLNPAETAEIFYRHARPHHLDRPHAIQRAMAERLDGSIHIESSPNTRALSRVDPRKQARVSRATLPLREKMLHKKWSLTLFPTQAYAQDADMSLADFEDFVYAATFADRSDPIAAWEQLSRRQEKLVRRLRGARAVRIVGPDTDLSLSVQGRVFINSDGHHNMPSGEVFTGPVEDSAEGHIRFDYPVCHAGREVDDVRLVFRKGLVVEASATKNEKFLRAMLDMDPGARRLGELGIGTNYGIDRFIKNILFDEKIGGTIHLALGRSYEETGGRNRSALHWDMIKDLRRGGALLVDGEVFQKDGRFRP